MSASVPDGWRERLRESRERRATSLASDPQSPIPREAFAGLDYYEPDPAYRFVRPLEEYDDPETVTVSTSTSGEQTYLRWGAFRFSVDGEEYTLQAYRADPEEDRLWIPFRDATSGEETYGTGRYLDLGERHRTPDVRWVLDFNEAYNPTCAYNEAYACPLPPTENWLDVRIEAGEKAYPGEPVSGEDHHRDHGNGRDQDHDHENGRGHDN